MSEINGILDNSTQQVVVLSDDKITLRGNVKIHGVLDVGLIKTTEIIADSRFEKKFLTFAAPEGTDLAGTGLIWADKVQNKQLVYRANPDRFFFSEHLELPSDKAIIIDGTPLLTYNELGATVVSSNLRKVGTLKELKVGGNVNLGDTVFFSPTNQRFSIGIEESNALFSIYDNVYDVEFVVEGNEHGNAKVGTYNNKGLDFVTGNQTRVSIGQNGNITLGAESTQTTLNGKVGINVKNPKEALEIAGNIKFQGKLFATADNQPTEGSYQKGDIIWNSEPLPSKYIGWVCTASGNPGIWAPFGLIAG